MHLAISVLMIVYLSFCMSLIETESLLTFYLGVIFADL